MNRQGVPVLNSDRADIERRSTRRGIMRVGALIEETANDVESVPLHGDYQRGAARVGLPLVDRERLAVVEVEEIPHSLEIAALRCVKP